MDSIYPGMINRIQWLFLISYMLTCSGCIFVLLGDFYDVCMYTYILFLDVSVTSRHVFCCQRFLRFGCMLSELWDGCQRRGLSLQCVSFGFFFGLYYEIHHHFSPACGDLCFFICFSKNGRVSHKFKKTIVGWRRVVLKEFMGNVRKRDQHLGMVGKGVEGWPHVHESIFNHGCCLVMSTWGKDGHSPYYTLEFTNMPMENNNLKMWCISYLKWWFSFVMLVYQRVGNEQMNNKVGVEHFPDIVYQHVSTYFVCVKASRQVFVGWKSQT